MAKTNYSAGKRQREADKAMKRKRKDERSRNRQSGGEIPIATVDEIQGGAMLSIDEVVQSVHAGSSTVDRSHTVPSRLFVGGLSFRTTSAELREAFAAIGPVDDAIVVIDRDTGDSRGFGFVTMSDRRDAAIAIRKLGGTELDGRTLVVRQATDRTR